MGFNESVEMSYSTTKVYAKITSNLTKLLGGASVGLKLPGPKDFFTLVWKFATLTPAFKNCAR